MTDGTLYSIGQLAARTGLTVKTVRFYSDAGLVMPVDRTHAGHRRYDIDALARLDLIRTLRELGIDLATIRRVLDREVTLQDVAAVHARAIDAQLQVLRLRRAVLRAVAKRGSDPKETELMHRLAHLSDEERQRIISDFWDSAFDGLDIDPDFEARMRAARPALPDDPSPEQVEAWVELAELVQDPDFRASVRRMGESHAAGRAAEGEPTPEDAERQAALVAEKGTAALEAGIDPMSAQARPIADEIVAALATEPGQTADPAFRRTVIDRWETFTDARAERYWRLLGIVNGWPPFPSTVPAHQWVIAALRASVDG
jgi:DNA-binding transcriptional MerR regulator